MTEPVRLSTAGRHPWWTLVVWVIALLTAGVLSSQLLGDDRLLPGLGTAASLGAVLPRYGRPTGEASSTLKWA